MSPRDEDKAAPAIGWVTARYEKEVAPKASGDDVLGLRQQMCCTEGVCCIARLFGLC